MHHPVLLVVDLDELAEAGRVVVVSSLGVAERLEDRSSAQYCLLHAAALAALLTQRCQVMQQQIRALCLACTD